MDSLLVLKFLHETSHIAEAGPQAGWEKWDSNINSNIHNLIHNLSLKYSYSIYYWQIVSPFAEIILTSTPSLANSSAGLGIGSFALVSLLKRAMGANCSFRSLLKERQKQFALVTLKKWAIHI